MGYHFKDKKGNLTKLNNYMLAKTLSMFEYVNLPESIPHRELEYLIQVNGYAYITEVNGVLYAFEGSIGGEQDVYGNPKNITINNVALKFNKTLNIKEDGVLIKNDDMVMGLIPLFNRYNSFIVENDINMMLHGFNNRMQKLISAPDDKTKESAELYIKKAVDGEIAVIGENAILDGIRVHGNSSQQSNPITNLIEFQQYIKATLYNEVGLSANFNMKRERLVSGEVDAGEDSQFAFVYNMLACRLRAIEKLNEKYSLNLSVDFGSVWSIKEKELVDDKENTDEQKRLVESGSESSDEVVEQEKVSEKDELLKMLEDETLSEDDRKAVQDLIDEMEGDK